MDMKPIREWLNELPEPYRSQAMENYMNASNRKVASTALADAFFWDQTPEGYDYWHDLYNSLTAQQG